LRSPEKSGLVEAALLLGVGAWALFFQLTLPGKRIAEADYAALGAVLEAQAQPGDVVLLHPWWTERARLFVPERVPVVGFQGSDGAELTAHPRIWLIDQPDQPRAGDAAFAQAFLPRRTAIGATQRFGNLQLTLYANGRHKPLLFSSVEALPRAQVFLEASDGARLPCTPAGTGGFACPGNSAVKAEWHEVRFEPRRCIRFYPPGGPRRVVAQFDNVPAAESYELLAGYTWDRGSFKGRTTVELGLEVNGARAGGMSLPAGLEGLQRSASGPVAEGSTVTVWAQTANPHDRELCFELFGWGKAP
jgi:hypothetical protein